jgi:uncharacterized LabA/DUF88 family protein
MKDTFVFIDAGFLSKLSKYFGSGKYLGYNIIKFSENIANRQNMQRKKIFYYTAPPYQSNNPSDEERKRKDKYDTFIQKLSQNKKIIIREGRCQKIVNKNGFVKYSQKAVDSFMVMDMMSVPIKNKEVKDVILIACDSDFVPIINELKSLGINIILYTYFTKRRDTNFARSNYLMNVVSKYVRLTKQDFDNSRF